MSELERSARTPAPPAPRLPSTRPAPTGPHGLPGRPAATAATAAPEYRPPTDEDRVGRLVGALLGADDALASGYVRGLLEAGVSAERVYMELLTPAAHRLGDLWSVDSCDFVEVTVAVGRIQRLVRELSRVFLSEPRDGAPTGGILLTAVAGEQHTLGLFLLSEFFLRDGWDVSIGPPLAVADLLALLRERWFDIVGFSVACDTRLDRLAREITRVRRFARNRRLVVLVGGRVFNERPGLVMRVGADGTASDAPSAPTAARRLLAERDGGRSSPLDMPAGRMLRGEAAR